MDETPRQLTHVTTSDYWGLRKDVAAHCDCAVPRFDHRLFLGTTITEWCHACDRPSEEQAFAAMKAVVDAAARRFAEGLQAALVKVSKAFGEMTAALTEFVRRAREEKVPGEVIERMVLDCAAVIPWATSKGLADACTTTLGYWAEGAAWSPWIWAPAHYMHIAIVTHIRIEGCGVDTFEAPRSLVPNTGEHPDVTEHSVYAGGLCFVVPIAGQPGGMDSIIRIAASQGARRVVLVGTKEEIAAWRKSHEAAVRAEKFCHGDAAVAMALALLGAGGAVGLRAFATFNGLCDALLVEAPVPHHAAHLRPGVRRRAVGGAPRDGGVRPSPATTQRLVLAGDMMDRIAVREAMDRPMEHRVPRADPWWTGPVERIAANVFDTAPAKHLHELREAEVIDPAVVERVLFEMRTTGEPPHGWRQEIQGEWKVQSTPYEAPIFVDKTTFKVVVP